MDAAASGTLGILLDIDGVLYVGDEPIEGAIEAFSQLRRWPAGLRLVTNTTSRSRAQIVEHLRALSFDVDPGEVLTPATMAVRYCRKQGFASVATLVGAALVEDLVELHPVPLDSNPEAIVLGDLGDGFTPAVMNEAFRALIDGAALVALQHNRYWLRSDGLALDVGAYAAALEFASGREAVVVGKPAPEFFAAAIDELGVGAAVMVGDDVEADVGGAMAAGLAGVLVRTGKFRQEALSARITPTAIVDSIVAVPRLIERLAASY
jgi:phospholysine phosphohistidine inorganic pyrophosphate phosphatase